MQERSRQDRTRDLLFTFVEGNVLTTNELVMSLYPKEFDRFKKEFPTLSFKHIRTCQTEFGKKFEVKVSKSNE